MVPILSIVLTICISALCPHSLFLTCDSHNTQQYNLIIERLNVVKQTWDLDPKVKGQFFALRFLASDGCSVLTTRPSTLFLVSPPTSKFKEIRFAPYRHRGST